MDRTTARTPINARPGIWLGAVLAAALFTSWTGAQPALPGAPPAAPRAPRTREVLKTGIDSYKRGDYEGASRHFAQAQLTQAELTPSEQQDLTTFSAQNTLAIKSRKEGSALVRQAEEAVRKNDLPKAAAVLRVLGANQYLAPADKQTVANLNVRVQSAGPAAPAADAAPKNDPKALLAAARIALQNGDFDGAEGMAALAEKSSSSFTWLSPWGDTPAKVRRDVQAARAKAAPAAPAAAEAKDSGWSLPGMKNLFARGTEKPAEAAKLPGEPTPAKKDVVLQKGETAPLERVGVDFSAPPVPGALASKSNSSPAGGGIDASPLPLPPAPLPPVPPLPPASPIQQVAHSQPKETKPAAPAPSDTKARARNLLRQGFQAMEAGELDTARKLAHEAKDLRAELDAKELGPDQLLHEVQRRAAAKTATAAKTPTAVPDDPRAMVRECRALMQQNRFEDAEKLCSHAASVQGARWGLFEDSPEKVRRDLQKARGLRDRQESVRLLADARKLHGEGNLAEAKKLAWRAQQLHGPYGAFDFGDRPQKLLDEIQRAELAQKRDNPPVQVAEKAPAKAPAKGEPAKQPLASAAANSAAKNRAVALLRESQSLERQGKLVEAYKKAGEAKQQGASFALGEESPEAVLLALSAKGKRQVQATLHQVTESVSRGGEPARFGKAMNELAETRRLAQTFGLDTYEVDQKAQWLQRVASNAGVSPPTVAQAPVPPLPPVPTAPSAPTAPGGVVTAKHEEPVNAAAELSRKLGLEKLDKARLELRSGNTAVARRLAEDAFTPTCGVQREAAAVLSSIDAEEHNQRVLAADRTLQAGVDAFNAKDYRRAVSVLREVDVQLLAPDRQARVREMMGTTEMQSAVVQAGLKETKPGSAPGTAVATDAKKETPKDDALEHARAMEKIQFDRMAQHGLQANRTALELFKGGQEMKAIEVLNGYLEEVKTAQLDPERSRQLRAGAEKRLQEFRTLQAQKLLDKTKQDGFLPKHNEGEMVAKQGKQREEISDLIRQSNALRKESKFKEALAVCYKVNELDPDNVANTVAIRQLETMINEREYQRAKKENEATFLRALDHGVGPLPTDDEPIKMSQGAIERHKSRAKDPNIWSQRSNPVERAIEQKLNHRYSFNWKDSPLHQVIDDLGRMVGENVVPNTRALQEANVNMDHPLTLNVENMSLKSALNILLNKLKLTYVIRDEALQITTLDDSKGNMKQVVYPVTDLVVPVENHPLPDVYNLQAVLQRHAASQSALLNYSSPTPFMGAMALPGGMPVNSMSTGLGSAFGTSSTSTPANAYNPVPDRKPGQSMEAMLIDMIKSAVHASTWKEMGGPGTIQYFPLGMALIINQSQEVQEDIATLLASLRRLQDLEVSIEMRLVSVSEAFYERIGLDFDVNFRTPSTRFEQQLLDSSFAPFKQVNRNLGVGPAVFGLTPAGTLTPDLNVPIRNSSFLSSIPPFGGYTAPGVDGGISLGLAFLSDIQVFMLLEAAQGDRRSNIMQAPRITVFNGQTAFINVSVTQFVNLGIVAIPVNGQIVFQPQNTGLPIGVTMTVTPVVSADRRFVRLNLTPNMTNLIDNLIPVFPVQVPVPNLLEGPGAGSTPTGQPVLFNTFLIQQPAISTISLDTTVNVPDGGTVLLGGLKTMAEGRNEQGPPILSKIPYLSRLFRNVGYGREGQSLMIMVTPRIIINEEEERIYMGLEQPIPRP